MTWLWTDTLAALLVEHDRVAPARVADWVDRPVAYRLPEEKERALDLARLLLEDKAEPAAGNRPFCPA